MALLKGSKMVINIRWEALTIDGRGWNSPVITTHKHKETLRSYGLMG